MARLGIVASLGAILIASFAGCLDASTSKEAASIDPESLPHSHGMEPMMGDFAMTMGECEEGGFVAAYPLGEGSKQMPGGWTRADITDEIGKPTRTGTGTPATGPLMGNWHMGYRCADPKLEGGQAAADEIIFGWVGNMIEAPAFDPGGADLHFVISGLGIGNGTIADVFKASTTASISHAYVAKVDWYVPRSAPRSAAYVEFSDVEKGIYMSASELAKYTDRPARTVRLWWQVPVDGSEEAPNHNHESVGADGMDDPMHEVTAWHPVYWDITSTGSEQYLTPQVDSVEVACHRGIPDHGPQGGACQPTLTDVYEHKSITFTQGDVLMDITLTERWSH
jgi:hypothetical protein